MNDGMCSVCLVRGAVAKGQCMTCYQYERRTGKRRPFRLTKRQADLNWARLQRELGRSA